MAAEKPIPLVAYRSRTAPEPPAELGVTGCKLWRGVLTEWDIEGASALAVLEQACQAYDRAESLRRQIQVTGELIETGGGGIKANPLIMAELQARGLVARLLARLDCLTPSRRNAVQAARPRSEAGKPCRSGARSTSRRR